MKIVNEQISNVPIESISPHPRNPRRGVTSVIVESINHNGFYGVVVVQKSTNYILAGNHRYLAARQAGATSIPVAWVDVDDRHAEKIMLADNRTSDLAEYDDAALAALLKELSESESLVGTGYTEADLASLLPDPPSEEHDPPEEDRHDALVEKWGVESGQIWEIGEHRLLCSDCTDETAWRAVCGDRQADLMLTDPPYGVAYEGKTSEALSIENDRLDREGLTCLIKRAFDAAELATRAGAYWYATVPAGPLHTIFAQDWVSRGILRQILVWVKNAIVLGHSEYHYQHEPILFGWRCGGSRRRNENRSRSSVWAHDKPSRSDLHPTMKPISLWEQAITDSTDRGDLIYDPFCGSGTTILAAEHTARIARCIEIDPRYVAATLTRCETAGIGPIQRRK